jgi:hemolysin activation/secretion protein
MDIGDIYFRHFVNAKYTNGLNRQDNETINIRDEYGIRGLSHNDLEGLKRLVFNFESRAFTPWKLLGFQFSFFAFTDLGWIGKTSNSLTDHDFFSAMGLGGRIRNEGLVFQTFNLRFSYYPITPEGISNYGFVLSASEPVFFSYFFGGKPQIIPYD